MAQTYQLPEGYLDPDDLIQQAQIALLDGETLEAIACNLTALVMIVNKWRTGNWINRDLDPLPGPVSDSMVNGQAYCDFCQCYHVPHQHQGVSP